MNMVKFLHPTTKVMKNLNLEQVTKDLELSSRSNIGIGTGIFLWMWSLILVM